MADDVHAIADAASRIRANPLLWEIYRDVYARLLEPVPADAFPRLLELGSGGGFLRDVAPHAITSECVATPAVDRVIDACQLETYFGPGDLDAIVAFNVFHHLPEAGAFLHGAERVLRRGGRIVLIEPWFTTLGQWFYRLVHHEPFVLDPDDWTLRGEGRLDGANERLPTSMFRDSDVRFAREFPALRIRERQPFHKGLYIASGGLTFNTRIPGRLARALVALDRALPLGNDTLGLFARVVVERV